MIYKIVFLGPQGSGKGTQAEFLAEKLNIPNISTGHIFRENIKNQTELGKEVTKYLDAGEIVPHEITVKVTIARIQEDDCKNGFILDGYPRDREQYDAMEKFTKMTHAIEIWISDEEALTRISGRRSCECGTVYHMKYNPPLHNETCDKCGGKLFIRDDDKPAQIKTRLSLYHKKTEPLINLYKDQGIHLNINGEKSIAEVNKELLEKMGLS